MQFLYAAVILVPLLLAALISFNNPKRRSTKIARAFYLTVIFIFTYVPIVVLIIFSFNSARSTGVWEGFSLKWYKALFEDSQLMSALYTTVIVAFISAVVSTIFGTFASIGIFYMKSKIKNAIMNITYLPVLNADIITGVSLVLFFNLVSIPLGYVTLLLSHICFSIPYVILSVMPKLKQMDNNLYEAALDLGSTPMTALRKVIIPEISPGIVSGFLLALTMSIDDFVISFFTAGPILSNLSIEIYSATKRGVTPEFNAISAIMFVVVLSILIIINVRKPKEEKKK